MTDKQKELLAKFNRVSEDKSQLQEFTRAIIMNEIGGDNIIPDNGSFYWPSDKQPLWDIQIGEKDYRLFDPISDNYYFTQPFFRIPTDECYLVDLAYYFDYLGEWGNLPNASYQYNGQNLIFTRDSDLEDAFWGLYDINPSAFEELTGLTNIAEDDSVLIALTSLYMSSDPDTNNQVLKRIILLIHYSGNALNEIREMEDPDSSDTPYDLVVIDDNRTTPPFWTKLDISESNSEETYTISLYNNNTNEEYQIIVIGPAIPESAFENYSSGDALTKFTPLFQPCLGSSQYKIYIKDYNASLFLGGQSQDFIYSIDFPEEGAPELYFKFICIDRDNNNLFYRSTDEDVVRSITDKEGNELIESNPEESPEE